MTETKRIYDITEPAPEFRYGFDDESKAAFKEARERMFARLAEHNTSWGEGKYKRVTDPETGQKVYMGNGNAVHPTKKKRMKQNGDNAYAAVSILRYDTTKLIPVIERRSLVIPSEENIPGQMGVPSDLGYIDRRELSERGILADYMAGLQARQRIAREHNARVVAEYKAEHKTTTANAAYAYQDVRFKLLHLLAEARESQPTPAEFYKKHGAEIRSVARERCEALGVEFGSLVAYVSEHAPKFAAIFEEPKVVETTDKTPADRLAELRHKLELAKKRRDKAIRDIEKLELEIEIASPVHLPCEYCRIGTPERFEGAPVCRPCYENNIAVGIVVGVAERVTEPEPVAEIAVARSKKAERRAARRERRKAKRQKKAA
jgi:hypothetical protein